MSSSAALALSVRKEARALLPLWLAYVSALIIIAMTGGPRSRDLGQLLYILGSLTLASWSIGHEYTQRTLPLLLSLPSARRRLLGVKLGVLVPMLATLGAVAIIAWSDERWLGRDGILPALALLCAVMLAPLLTMVCRSPLAGVVFAAGITGWVHLLAQTAGLIAYGSGETAAIGRAHLVMSLRLWGFLSVSGLAAVGGWLTFMQLEAIDGLPGVHWPHDWRRAAVAVPVARRRNPFWLLALKELRLQQMAFIVAGLFILGGIAVWMLRNVIAEFDGPLEPLAAMNGLMLAWLVGSLASAEERHLGTLESQTLLPIAAWQQWTIKAGITLALAMLFAIGLPVLAAIDGPQFNPVYAVVVVVVTMTGLYVSTLCSSGIRALTISGPALLVVFWLLGRFLTPFDADPLSPVGGVVLAGLLLLALYFAFENHRSAERDLKRVARQLLVMTALLFALIAGQF